MSGARKKSSFQITSITSEFEPPVAPPAVEPPEDAAAPRNGPPGAASRFRLVKLDQGPGEPFKRGRWTCLEFYDHDPELQAVGRLLGTPRHPQSLDSRLELAGLLPKPHGYSSLLPPSGLGHSQGMAHPSEHLPHSLGSGDRTPGGRAHSHGATAEPSLGVEELLLPHSLAQRIRREVEERHKVPPRGSRPSSPAPPFFREGSPVRRGSDPFGGHLSLARSMFAMGGHQDSDDESGSGSSMIAIDNKIEQAMDLVKSHLMFAVREEVEVLREQIRELAERNAALEWENGLLRSLASPEQLAQLRRPTA
ncbi:TSC22 domain family protein 4 isoform X2 [Gopherus flavomarginatus]|uniref:TSC22 domain family protein 4 isoform X2 n=1 Tax=Gopherus flavomarginatus TaxID=286002 RepID=UPI0021CBD33A|nr:TSC22 domain family protein 4 isoform X2 [Gopherus flavomarginatus]